MAENPRHGDEIIVKKKGSLGGERLIASRLFQAFLDDLAADSDQVVDISDIVQLIAALSGQNQQLNSELARTNKLVAMNVQELAIALGQNQQLLSELIHTNKIVQSNSQELAIMQSEINNLRSGFSVLGKQIDNVEQIAHVD